MKICREKSKLGKLPTTANNWEFLIKLKKNLKIIYLNF